MVINLCIIRIQVQVESAVALIDCCNHRLYKAGKAPALVEPQIQAVHGLTIFHQRKQSVTGYEHDELKS